MERVLDLEPYAMSLLFCMIWHLLPLGLLEKRVQSRAPETRKNHSYHWTRSTLLVKV